MSEQSQPLVKLMIAAGLNPPALARKASLPIGTILKAMKGHKLSPTIEQGLRKVLLEEIDANTRRSTAG